MPSNNFNISGLTNEQVVLAREKFGQNKLDYKKESGLLKTIWDIVKEPMMILLLVAATIYFISGKTGDGVFLVAAIIFQTSIPYINLPAVKMHWKSSKPFRSPNAKSFAMV